MAKLPKRAFRDGLTSKLEVESQGILSAESILIRLNDARKQSAKESNRLLVLAMIFTVFFLIKIAGLRIDIVFADQKIFSLPYGIFIFCVISQLLFTASIIRGSDNRVIDRMMKGICDKVWPATSDLVYRTFPNESGWFEIISHAMRKIEGEHGSKFFFWISSALTILLVTPVFCAPFATGIYFLSNWDTLIISGNIDVQFYSVVFSTVLCAFWVITGGMIVGIDEDESEK